MSKEVMKLALEALESTEYPHDHYDALVALRESLASPVQEPVAWVERWYGSGQERGWWIWEKHSLTHGQPVAFIGIGAFAERLTSIIVEKHNSVLFARNAVQEPFADDPHGHFSVVPNTGKTND